MKVQILLAQNIANLSFQFVAEKVGYSLSAGVKVIACIGEKLEEREAGKTNEVVASQLSAIAGYI